MLASFRPALLLLMLLALLAGCSVYENVFHPYRLPTPEAPPEFKRQMKAKKLANHNRDKAAKAKKPPSADPDAAPAPDAPPDAGTAANADPDGGKRQPAAKKSGVRYDKAGLMKKPKLLRRRITKPVRPGFHPFRGLKNYFKQKLHGKRKPKPKAAPADAPVDAPADNAPADAPAEPTPDK